MNIFNAPTVLMPTLVKGYCEGPIRCESLDGSEMWLDPKPGIIILPPFQSGGKTWCVSHIQKKSHSFTLEFSPFSYHWGRFWHLQEQDQQGTWLPGTEKGIYWRTPGWRWDSDPALKAPWVFSKGYAGSHLD